jgi:3-methyladenine DNA glycosylase AlkD
MGKDRKTARQIKRLMKGLGDPIRAKFVLRYFKSGAGQYGEGDRFLGISAPVLRNLAKDYRDLEMKEVLELLHSPTHEERSLALLIWNHQFARGTDAERKTIHRLYLKNTKWINNWDLVDCSAEFVIGRYLLDHDPAILNRLAASKVLWQRRIAIISTFAFIKAKRFELPLKMIDRLINDREDLIHKACGWMLREIGKRDEKALRTYLDQNASRLPRTALRYSIERFDPETRARYLAVKRIEK